MQPILVNILQSEKDRKKHGCSKSRDENKDLKIENEKINKIHHYLQKELEHNPFFFSF